jgi:hypothetical protein
MIRPYLFSILSLALISHSFAAEEDFPPKIPGGKTVVSDWGDSKVTPSVSSADI